MIESMKKISKSPTHPSSKTMQLKMQEKQLAKQGKYEEAHRVKMQFLQSVKNDEIVENKIFSKSIESSIRILEEQQKKEEDVLESRIDTKIRSLETMRDQEIEEIDKRTKVVISDIESKHIKQKTYKEKELSSMLVCE